MGFEKTTLGPTGLSVTQIGVAASYGIDFTIAELDLEIAAASLSE